MEMVIIEKQALDGLIFRIELLRSKIGSLYADSGIAPQKWIDNDRACLHLSVSKRTLQHLRDSGTLPFTKIGGKVFYKPEEIEKMLLSGYTCPDCIWIYRYYMNPFHGLFLFVFQISGKSLRKLSALPVKPASSFLICPAVT
jgi:hypothetical protein